MATPQSPDSRSSTPHRRISLKIPARNHRRKRSESSHQLFLDFGDADECAPIEFSAASESLEDCFQRGCTAEDEGRLAEAVGAYRSALQIGGPQAAVSFNLANALFALGEKSEAIACYQQAVALRPAYCEAWNNLGVALTDIGDAEAACSALKRAVLVDSTFLDARYNLADLLDSLQREAEAREHWQAYVRADSTSEWAAYARSRLADGIS